MASIVEKHLNDGSRAYLVRFRTADGQQRSRQFKRKRDAGAFVNVVEVDRMSGALIDPRLGKVTVAEWWDQWWPTVTNLRASTRARDAQYFRTHVRPAFGDTPLGKLDRTSLRTWMARLGAPDGSDLAPATIHKVVQVFNKCVRAALEDRLIMHNPVAKLPLPKVEHQEMRFITSDELWRLSDEMDPRYRAFVLLAGFGGLRLGELLGLRWGRIDFSRRRVNVAETLVDVEAQIHFGPPKTKASVRTVPVPSFVCEALREQRPASVIPTDLVFRSPDGHPIRPALFRRRFWDPAVRSAGLAPLRIHDLRHTAVSLWIADGANPKQVATLAGHTSVSVVFDRYGHLYPAHDEELMANLERRGQAVKADRSPL
ncbi:MAG: site-specific integrase, partial [Ilumatobacteraceae bacterium]